MNDFDQALASYERYREALSKASQNNKTVIFDALGTANITLVRVEFDGEGDSGAITDITAYHDDDERKLPTTAVTILQTSWGDAEPHAKEKQLCSAVEILCYDYLEDTHGGWENNEGGYGEFRLDVAARTIELEFNARYVDVFTEIHKF